MDSPRDSPSAAATTVPRDIKEKLGVFKSQVFLMILSFVNGNFQETTPTLIEHLLKLERDSDNYSGIINYTFNRLKVDPAHFFTPDRDIVELPREQGVVATRSRDYAAGIELRLALVDFLLSLCDQQTASKAIKKIAGASLEVLQRTPLEIIEEVCKRRSVEDVLSISNSVAVDFNRAGFFDDLRNTEWLHNRNDVNRFLGKESGFCSPSNEMILFMTEKLSTNELINENVQSMCQKHLKRVACCVLVLGLSILALIIIIGIGIGISLGLSHRSSNSINQSMEIGDKLSSSALIPVPSNVSSILLKSRKLPNIPSEVTVFLASSIPPYGTQILPSTIPHNSAGNCTPYNLNGDEPVYLLPGSTMNYALTVSGSNYSQCTAQLVLFHKRTEYVDCKYNSSNIVKAFFLTNGPVNISIRINESADYYVRLVKEDPNISVTADITVHQVYYNTSHLSTANDCEQISNDDSCTVHNHDIKQKWNCSNTEWYVILKPTSIVKMEYNYKTPSFDYCLLKECLIITSVICIVLFILIALIGYCLWTCKGTGSRRNGSIQYGTFTN